jgi:hypothetical protein
MTTTVQFTGTLNAGTSNVWFAYGSPRNNFINWSARPLTPNSRVGITVLSVEQAGDGTLTYWFRVNNEGPQPATFEMVLQNNPY